MQQTRNVIHTELCNKGEREEKRERIHTDLRGSPWSRLHPPEGKQRAFLIMVVVYKWKLIFEKYRASLPYIGRGQNRKNNRINFHIDLGHNPTIHHLELTSI